MPQTSTLTEFVLATHFETDLPFRVMDLADWARTFAEDFPVAEQLPTLARIDLTANPFQMMLVQEPILPMMRLTSADGSFYLKLQTDRFALGWARTTLAGAPDAYPGFDGMLERWSQVSAKFETWLKTRTNLSATTRLIELAYFNLRPFPTDGRGATLSEVFSFMKPVGRKLNAFQANWTEFLEPSPTAARVTMSAGVTMIEGDRGGFTFNFFGFSPVSGSITGRETRSAVTALHGRILDMYEATIISDNV